MEFLTGVVFVLVFLKFGISWDTLFALVIGSLFIVIAGTDWKEKVVFDMHTYSLIGVGILYAILVTALDLYQFRQLTGGFNFTTEWIIGNPISSTLLGIILGFVVMEIVARIGYLIAGSRAFGEGDSFIAAGLGAVFGWRMLVIILIMSVIIQVIITLPVYVKKEIDNRNWMVVLSLGAFLTYTIAFLMAMQFGWLENTIAYVLSAIVLAKLVRESSPVIYASWARVINMRNGNVSVGAPEFGMLRVATTQMGKYYNLPTGGGANLSDSLILDHQLGVEQCATSLLPALSGMNMAQGMGLLAGMNAVSAEALILASEVANYVKRITNGINVDTSADGLGLIKEIGPCGDFISTSHTFKHFKRELWNRKVFDCSTVKMGKDYIGTSVVDNTLELLDKLMNKYIPIEVPENAESVLENIIHSKIN